MESVSICLDTVTVGATGVAFVALWRTKWRGRDGECSWDEPSSRETSVRRMIRWKQIAVIGMN
jgi:hypothetical protein